MKVVIGLITLSRGGAEFQASLLARDLSLRGHDVSIYTMMPSESPEVDVDGIPVRRVQQARISRSLTIAHITTVIKSWFLWLRCDRPDVVIGFLPYPHMILSLVSPPRTKITGRRCCVWSDMAQYPHYKNVARFLRFVRMVSQYRTHYLVCNSETVERDVRLLEGWKSTRVILNGWPESNPTPDNIQIVCAARERPEKNLSHLREASVRKRVDLTITEVPKWESGGILLHPSLSEGCSNSIGMAMSHGWPVVAFDCAGNRELLGNAGILVSIKSGIEKLLWESKNLKSTHLSRRMYKTRAIQRCQEHYSLKRMVDNWESLVTA